MDPRIGRRSRRRARLSTAGQPGIRCPERGYYEDFDVPFLVVRMKDGGWLVEEVGLALGTRG